MNSITVVHVKSDNFEGLMTFEAYSEYRLQMSTGDFHAHSHMIVSALPDAEIYTLEQMLEDQGVI